MATTTNLSALEIHKLTQEQYDRLAAGEITGKSIDENALYMTTDDSSDPSSGASFYAYGTEDITAGTSELETGKLYFVYE